MKGWVWSNMKILSPIDHTEELEPLYRAGAGEVYCGYVPDYWTEAFNHALGDELEFYQVGINKRDVRNCNLSSLEDLKLLCQGCRQFGMELFLTVPFLVCSNTWIRMILESALHQELQKNLVLLSRTSLRL